MNQDEILFQRQELYNEVWSSPMTKLGKKYSISDNGLRKICKSMGIPLPKGGHWAKKEHKKELSIVALPDNTNKKYKESYRYVPSKPEEKDPIELPPGIDVRFCLNQIQQGNYHPLVVKTERAYNAKSRNDSDVNMFWGTESLAIGVSRACLFRSLHIMDRILKVFEMIKLTCGIEKRINGGYDTFVEIDKERIHFEIIEPRKRVEHVKTPDEIKRGTFTERWDYFPRGELSFHIKGSYFPYKQWKDGKQKLEDRLEEIIVAFFECSKMRIQENIRREEAHKEWEEKERIAAEQARLKREEDARQKLLEEQAINWNRAVFIHNFVKASEYEFNQVERTPQEHSEFKSWSNWAYNYAETMNPFRKKWYQR